MAALICLSCGPPMLTPKGFEVVVQKNLRTTTPCRPPLPAFTEDAQTKSSTNTSILVEFALTCTPRRRGRQWSYRRFAGERERSLGGPVPRRPSRLHTCVSSTTSTTFTTYTSRMGTHTPAHQVLRLHQFTHTRAV